MSITAFSRLFPTMSEALSFLMRKGFLTRDQQTMPGVSVTIAEDERTGQWRIFVERVRM